MARILAILLFVVSFVAWNRIRVLLTPEGVTAALREIGPALRNDPLASLAFRLEASKVTEADFVAASGFAALLIASLGYLCDVLLGRKGFGPLGNAALLVVGAALATAAWVMLAPQGYLSILSLDVFLAALGGGGFLVSAALMRHFIALGFDDFTARSPRALPEAPPSRTPRKGPEDVLRRPRR